MNRFNITTIILVLVLIIVYIINTHIKTDTFSSGALTQLYAKGIEDQYLTTGTDKYIPPYFYNNWFFNAPVRVNYPYNYLHNYLYNYPYNHHWFW